MRLGTRLDMKGRENKQNTVVYVMFVRKTRKYLHHRICAVTHNFNCYKYMSRFDPNLHSFGWGNDGTGFQLFRRVKNFDWIV